jgi:tetratricopeptide (TPR) repeat protein
VSSFLLATALLMTGQGLSLPARLALIVAAERIPVPVALKAADFVFEPLTGTLELRRQNNAKAVAQRMAMGAGQICSEVEAVGTTVVVRCKTKRIDAHLVVERGNKIFIEIEQLRGLPFRHDGDKLSIFYDPQSVGFGAPCPGTMLVGRAECALRDGRTEEATALFRQALGSAPQASFAGMRLGDMAAANGDIAGALNYYRRYSYGDLFGRLAAARLCELDGSCLDNAARVFGAADKPEPVRSELLLRGARVALFADRFSDASKLLLDAVNDLCRRMLLVVLDHVTGDDAAQAIEAWLGMPDKYQGPLVMPMLRAVAEKAASIGAPGFAANLLAANATSAEGPGLADHLLRTAELYLAAGDIVRARVVVDYADTRSTGRSSGFVGPRWVTVRNQVRGASEDGSGSALSAFDTLATEGARDVAAAYGSIARARTVQP